MRQDLGIELEFLDQVRVKVLLGMMIDDGLSLSDCC